MEQQRIRTRRSSRQNSVTEKTGDTRLGSVNISPSRKHKISTTNDSSTSKRNRQFSRNKQDVKAITKAVITKLLSAQTTKSTPQRTRAGKKRKAISPLACTFSKPFADHTDGDDLSSLQFDSIEADGGSVSTSAIEADGGDTQRSSMDPKVIEEVAQKLRNIGDSVNKEAKKAILTSAVKIVANKAYKTFKESLDVMVDQSQHFEGDGSERYFVGIVWLLTQTVIKKATEENASFSMEEVASSATDYIVENYPGWIEG